jgi:hypothetical protein
MKTIIKLISIIALQMFFCQLYAQNEKPFENNQVEGIYLTLSDFKNNKLFRLTDMQHKGDKINMYQMFESSEIISTEQGKEMVYYKDSIFAVKLINGDSYRFINHLFYLIADTSNLYIYTCKTTKTEYKQSGPRRIPKKVIEVHYLFGEENQKEVYDLTMANLRKFVLTDTLVHEAVCTKFTTDEMLTRVNPQTRRFEVNETIRMVVSK